jgi:ceramide glucosyltransferase
VIAWTLLGWLCMAGALFGACYQLFALWGAARFVRNSIAETSEFPPVTLFKALRGDEPRLKENLLSFCSQSYPGAVEIVFGVHALDDTAIPIVQGLRAQYPSRVFELVCSGTSAGANPKVENLIAMAPLARHEVFVLSDSDISVPTDYLLAIAGALERPGTGAVTCCYLGAPEGGVWARLSAMGIDYHFLPSVIAGVALGYPTPCFGATIAMRRRVLEQIGGFAAFSKKLADDYEIGRAIRALRLGVVLAPVVVDHVCTESSLQELFRHELRWARTIMNIDPLGFAGTIVLHTVPIAVIGAALTGFSIDSLCVAGTALISRLVLKLGFDRMFGIRGLPSILLPVRDFLSLAVYATAFCGTHVEWGGRGYAVTPDGVLERV